MTISLSRMTPKLFFFNKINKLQSWPQLRMVFTECKPLNLEKPFQVFQDAWPTTKLL